MLLRYTLCFLTRGDDVLMLLRNKPPNAGLWNGVGGHIEAGETPREACLREVQEETGFSLPAAHFCGLLTWSGFEVEDGGLYWFTAEAPAGEAILCDEGLLAWKPRSFLFHAPQVVSNLHIAAPLALDGAPAQEYHFDYHQGDLVGHAILPLPAWVDVDSPWQG
jgi:8-oxo-dGTP diphosphatase